MSVLDLTRLNKKEIKHLSRVKEKLLKQYEQVLNDIYKLENHHFNTYLSTILSRDHSLSLLFPNICYFYLVKELLKEKKYNIIISPNYPLGSQIKYYLKRNGLSIKVKNKSFVYFFSNLIFKNFKDLIYNIIYSLQSIYFSDMKRKKTYSNEGLILIDTFIVPEEIQNGDYVSRHYNHDSLYELATQEVIKKIYFVPTIVGTLRIGDITKNVLRYENSKFLFKNDYLKPIDYLNAIFGLIGLKAKSFYGLTAQNLKVKRLINFDYYNNLFNHSTFLGILNICFFKRLKQDDVRLSVIINWFENQVQDRGFNFGARKYFPKSKLKGYQPFGLYLDHLIVSKDEYKTRLVPDEIFVCASEYLKLAKSKEPNLNVKVLPSFRNFNLKFSKYEGFNRKNIFNVYVILPLNILIAKQMLEVIDQISLGTGFKISIQFHPEIPRHFLKSFDIQKYDISYQPFKKIINQADLTIMNGSSTILESLAFAKPTIILHTQGSIFINDLIPEYATPLVSHCWDEIDLEESINEFVSNPRSLDEHNQIGVEIRKNYFKSFENYNLDKFLQ